MAKFQFLKTKGNVRRFLNNLFQDVEKSFNKLLAVFIARGQNQLSPRQIRLMPMLLDGIPRAIIGLSREKRMELVRYYYDKFLGTHGYLAYVLLSPNCDDFELTVKIFNTFLDDFDACVLQGADDSKDRIRLMRFLFEVFATPKETGYLWQNLLSMGLAKNDEGIIILKELINRYSELPLTGNFGVVINNAHDGDTINQFMEYAYSDEVVLFPVYTEQEEQLLYDLISEVKEDKERQAKPLEETLEWIEENLPDLEHEAHSLWEVISTQAKFGLRSSGFDRIAIEVTGLSSLGVTDLQFFPEKEIFPHVRVRFWLQRRLPFAMDMVIKDGDISLTDDNERTRTQALLKLIALEAYFQIVMGIRPPRYEKLGGSAQNSSASRKRQSRTNSPTHVRARFRTLPEGHKMSQEAELKSIATFGYLPPKGKTFVKAHTRNNDGFQELKAELEEVNPLFAYSNDDLGFDPSSVN